MSVFSGSSACLTSGLSVGRVECPSVHSNITMERSQSPCLGAVDGAMSLLATAAMHACQDGRGLVHGLATFRLRP